MKKQLKWIDTLKGLGIVSVVVSHVYIGNTREFIGIFSMPLFFCLGGFLYSNKDTVQNYFKKKVIHLLIPYIAFIFLLYPIQLVTMLPQRDNFTTLDILKLILNPVVGGGYLWGLTSAMWFPTCFFITQQIANFLIKKVSQSQLIFYIFFLTILGYINSLYLKFFWLFQNAHLSLLSVPMFLIGFLFKQYYKQQNFYKISIFSITLSLLIITKNWLSLALDMKRTNYGIPFLSIGLALGLILFLINLAQFIDQKIPIFSEVLGSLGRASMVILCVHLSFIYASQGLNINISHFTLVFISVALSFLCYTIFMKFSVTRAIFLGSIVDFQKVFLNK